MTGHGEFPPPGAPTGGPHEEPRYGAPQDPAAPGPQSPPPGWAPPPPGYAQPGYAQPGYVPPGQRGPTGPMGAAHKPGAVPLRPLGLSDIYDAAFKIIRHNPRATVGSAVLVAAVSMAVPVLVTGVLSLLVDLSFDASGSSDQTTAELAALVGSGGALLLGTVLQSIGLILVTGMIARVCAAAAVGRTLSLAEAWRETRGRRWRLIGLTLLLAALVLLVIAVYAGLWVLVVVIVDGVWPVVVFGLVSVPLFLAAMCWFWVRVYYLPVPALMLEDVGVLGALRRGHALTRHQFWRTFGIALLTVVIAQIAGSMLSLPVSFLGQGAMAAGAPAGSELFLLVLSQAASAVVAAAFVSPFTAAVASLQYLDQRIRKEAYDVELMTRAGITVP